MASLDRDSGVFHSQFKNGATFLIFNTVFDQVNLIRLINAHMSHKTAFILKVKLHKNELTWYFLNVGSNVHYVLYPLPINHKPNVCLEFFEYLSNKDSFINCGIKPSQITS